MREHVRDEAVSIGERLSRLRSEHRYSIRKLAQRAGVSASLVSDIEKGKVEPSISTLKRLATAMGTTITFFFSEPEQASGRVIRATDRMVLPRRSELPSPEPPLKREAYALNLPHRRKPRPSRQSTAVTRWARRWEMNRSYMKVRSGEWCLQDD